jgi:hypothetical protein
MPAIPLMDSVLQMHETSNVSKESDNNNVASTLFNFKNEAKNDTDSETESILTSLYFSLVRDCNKEKIDDYVEQFIKSIKNMPDIKKAEFCSYIIVLAFQTRDCRGGKGERKISRYLFLSLYNYFPKTIESLVDKLPDFGYWGDLSELLLDISYDINKYENLKSIIIDTFVKQLLNDDENYKKWCSDKMNAISLGQEFNKKLVLSLAAKWAPKERRHYDKKIKIAKDIARQLFPDDFKSNFCIAMAKYRTMLSKFNHIINTTEKLMCERKFSEIEFKLVPGKCLKKYQCAFLNVEQTSYTTCVCRYPENMDRLVCRENLLEYLRQPKVKKDTYHFDELFIHEIIDQLMPNHYKNLNNEQIEILYKHWRTIYDEYKSMIDNNDISLSKGVILSDFSGSMSGTPINVSIASTIFISPLLKEPYRNKFLSFNNNPIWCTIDQNDTLLDKINSILNTPWGTATSFEKAYLLILDDAVRNKLQPEDIPTWFLAISDMSFDKANNHNSWETIYDYLEQRFIQIGLNTIGKPYQIPKLIYWNTRNDNKNSFPSSTNQPGLLIINGFSVSIFKEILTNQSVMKITPWMNIKGILKNERYETIFESIRSVSEAPYFRHYAITPDIEVLNDSPNPTNNDTPRKLKKKESGIFSYFTNYFS